MELSSDDDGMGFVKVDDEMGCNSEEDMEYVKVENADLVHEGDVDDDMEYEDNGLDPFPERIQGMDIQEVDLSYSPLTSSEDEHGSSDDDVGYEDYMCAYVESKQKEVGIYVNLEAGQVDDEKGDQDGIILPNPLPKRRQDMLLKEIVKDNVLPFLPAKSLIRFRSVSKEWDRWIRTPLFAHWQSYCCKDFSGYFYQYDQRKPMFVSLDNTAYGVPCRSLNFLPETVDIITSSNGLLLCQGRDRLAHYYVCNPATQDWVRLPDPVLDHGDEPSAVLAFEPSAVNCGGHYQVLCAAPIFDHVMFELYSSVTNSWKALDTALVEMRETKMLGNAFYMNGVAYMETSKREVIALHLASEVYESIPLPPGAPLNGVLAQAQGELCYIGLSHETVKNEYSVMIYPGLDLGLMRRVDLGIGPWQIEIPQYQVLPCLDGRRVMFVVGNGVYCYSLVDQCVQQVAKIALIGDSLTPPKKFLPYVNSLVQVAKP